MRLYIDSVWHALHLPFGYLLAPGKRIYLLFLFSSALFAGLIFVRRRGGTPSDFFRWLFPRSLWLHRSAVLDYKLVFTNAFIRAVFVAPFIVSTLTVVVAVAAVLELALGPAAPLDVSSLVLGVVYTLALFVVGDFSRYVLHRLLHRIPALWELHKVHHSARVLTPVTVYRSHPIEMALYAVRRVVSVGLVTGVFLYLSMGRATAIELLGINALGFAFNFLGANLRHSHVWLSFGPLWERWFISPAQHQIHHSRDPAHHDANFGAFLAVWDRLFGTLHLTTGRRRLRFGLAPGEPHHDNQQLGGAIVRSMVAASRRPSLGAWAVLALVAGVLYAPALL